MLFLQNILLGFTLSVPLGPVNIEAIRSGLKHGFVPAFFIGLGAISADISYLTLIYFGLGKYFLIPIIQKIILLCGAGLLFYIGVKCFQDVSFEHEGESMIRLQKNKYYKRGFFIAISSPMTLVWWLGVFGAVLSSNFQHHREVSYLQSFGIMVGCFIWITILALLVHMGKNFFKPTAYKIINRGAGLALIGFGLSFLLRLL